MNTGLLGKKLGMTRIFTDEGRWIDVTVLEAGPCTVIQRKTTAADGYEAVQLGFGKPKKESRCAKAVVGHFKKAGAEPMPLLCEFRVAESDPLKSGDTFGADLFKVGDHVDIAGTSKGRGYAGLHKRHGFRGGPGSHGSMFHRRPGSIGSSADPSKVVKGMRMAGHMGHARVTIQNLEVVKVDAEKNLLVVRGCVPGPTGGFVEVTKSVKGS